MDKSYLYSPKPVSWDDPKLKIPAEIKRALVEDMGFEQPSKIQATTIPMIVKEPFKDLIAQSQNGTGKTLAFVLSSIIRTDVKCADIQVVVVSHIRELAKQIYDVYMQVTKYVPGIKISLIIPENQSAGLGHILVGTPKSLLKVINANKMKFMKVRVMVIDEADAAFRPSDDISMQVRTIHKKINPKKQTLLFSATFSAEMLESTRALVKSATIMKMPQSQLTLAGVVQLFMKCEANKKFDTILEIFGHILAVQTIVFCNTKVYSKKLLQFMTSHGVKAGLIMGELTAQERDATMKSFKDRETTMLITTNLLSRGYDNRYVTFVINLDIPRSIGDRSEPDCEGYLHRIGRTGRFGDLGVALNIIEKEEDMTVLEKIKDFYKCEIKETNLDMLAKEIKVVDKKRKQEQDKAEEEAHKPAEKK